MTNQDSRNLLRGVVRDPVRFSRALLRHDLWQTQAAILRSVASSPRTAVKGCHASSKTFTAADAVLWWITRYPDGVAITTAPTWHQVERVLWPQIHKAARHARVRYPRPLQTELRIGPNQYAIGLSTDEGVRFQGFHGHILIVLDEAPGIRPAIWEAIEGIRAGGDVHVLALGNPTDPTGPFAEAFGTQAAQWSTFTISAFDTPNLKGISLDALLAMEDAALDTNPRPYLVTRRWVREKWIEWGQHGNPLWQARVLGEFPLEGRDTLYPLAWIEAARLRPATEAETDALVEGGIDVAGPGKDETVVAVRRGPHLLALRAWPDSDPRAAVADFLRTWQRDLRTVRVDSVGVGHYFVAALKDQGFAVEPVNVGNRAGDPERFANRKAELYWALRERLEAGDLSGLEDQDAIAQLAGVRYEHDARGRITIESKDALRRRGLPSPDRAEAIILAYAPSPHLSLDPTPGEWGRPILAGIRTMRF